MRKFKKNIINDECDRRKIKWAKKLNLKLKLQKKNWNHS